MEHFREVHFLRKIVRRVGGGGEGQSCLLSYKSKFKKTFPHTGRE